VLDYDLAAIEINPANCLACGVKQVSQGGGSAIVDIGPEIATRYHGRASNNPVSTDQGMIVWMDADSSPPFSSDVVALRYEVFDGGAVTNLGGACGNGGTNGFNGPVALGNSDLRLTLSGGGSNLLFASIQFGNLTTTCGPCTFNNQNSYFFVLGVSGAGSFPLAIPCGPGYLGLNIWTQWAVFLSGVNPCGTIPAGADVSFSNRLRSVIGT
jgi:hypothetical protein